MIVLYLEALAAIALSLSVLMAGAWMVQQRTGNSGWVDTIWTFSLGLVGAGSALWPIAGAAQPAAMAGRGLVAIWSIRLGSISRRTAGITDDPRYAAFAREWGVDSPRRMFVFLQNQGSDRSRWCLRFSCGAVSAARCGSGLSRRADPVVGIAGEALADAQLKNSARSRQPGPGCDVGLWRWSRHPNYFFEWFGWLAYPVIAISPTILGLGDLLAPVFMYWILVHVTGIPPLERRCCARAASATATISRAPACSFRCHRKREWSHELRLQLSDRRTGAAARRHHSRRDPAAVLAHRDAAGQRQCGSDASFADEMAARAIAEHTDEANAQHYEVPAAFFARVLGPNRKYSSCFYKEPKSTLQEAEEEALRQTVEHADLADGQSILELGCGWGSLSLWMARQFPNSQVTAVSNSHSQRNPYRGRGRVARIEESPRRHRRT